MATMSWATAQAAEFGSIMANKGKAAAVFAGRAWQQVLARDAAADGQFVYAVKSTGVYCKPSCPSRRPERKNVSFYPTAALAEAAGFRACLRCEPARVAPKDDPQAAAIAKATKFLSERAGERTSLDELAAAAGLGRFALQRGFKRVLGVTPGEFAREQRKERFREKVRAPKVASKSPITDAVYEAGFGSSSRLYEDVDSTLGMSPTAMKAGGAGETIRYAVTESPLGRVLVATTERGLCAVLFADSDAEAAAELRERFPQAVLRRDDKGLGEAVSFVLSRLRENPTCRFSSLPRARDGLPAAGVAGAAGDSARRDADVCGDRGGRGVAAGGARRRHGMRGQSAGCRGAVPSRGGGRRQAYGLSLGDRAQAAAAGDGARRVGPLPHLKIEMWGTRFHPVGGWRV
jgi:AraC family transcriptional regulator of adaptative response/methylated-DNA-[protein]-cysteine methyltransferase